MSYNCSSAYCVGSSASYGNTGSGANYFANPSPLEQTVQYSPVMRSSEETAEIIQPEAFFEKKDYKGNVAMYTEGTYLTNRKAQEYFSPAVFLKDIPTEFITSGDEEQEKITKSLVKDAFEATTGKTLPKDLSIRICNEEQMKAFHKSNNGKWNPGIRGFSINRRGFGTSEVFVMEDELAKLMLTMGHEIGHVTSLPMSNPIDEEAKAFSFSMAWMNSIKENNIGELSTVINPRPANNGLHNVAFDFVLSLMKKGRNALEVYLELIKGETSIDTLVVC